MNTTEQRHESLRETQASAGPHPGAPVPSEAEITRWLVERLAARLDAMPAMIGTDVPLAQLGMDSVAAVDLVYDLEEILGIPLDPALVAAFKTIRRIAGHLNQCLINGDGAREN